MTMIRFMLNALAISTALLIGATKGAETPGEMPAFKMRLWYLADGRDVTGVWVDAKEGGATIKAGDNSVVRIKDSELDGHSLRYIAAVQLAAGKTFYDWHFEAMPRELADWPKTVRGAFIRVVCEDHEFSTACVELLREDYSRRFYPLKALRADDRARAEKLQSELKSVGKPKPPYPIHYESYKPEKDAAVCNFHDTPHFLFHWGNDKTASGKDWWKEGKQELTFRWFEKVWDYFEAIGAPMPMADGTPDEKSRAKIPVYITGTGLPKHKEGFAFGGKSIVIHPGALGDGSSVVGHEFTHTMQLHMGGFRNSPLVGWFWECHANWSSHQFMPDYPGAFEVWLARAHYELNSSRFNYGSWLFLQEFSEDPRLGTAFPYEVWLRNRKDEKDSSIEDPLQTFMRLGSERVWKGDGCAGFGDSIGEMAARMVTMDFAPQWAYTRVLRNVQNGGDSARLRVAAEAVSDRPGWWRPMWSQAPRQFGVNFIDLIPDGKSATVEVDFTGINSQNADWRVTLVGVAADGQPRYSRTTHGGKLSLKTDGLSRVTMAIAATPTRYIPDEFRPGYGKKPRFPYEFSVRGATVVTAPPRNNFAKGDGAPHANGGGWVSKGAKVDAGAYVGPDAMVLDIAQVADKARIEGHAVVRNRAVVNGQAVVGDWAVVENQAKVSDDARIRGNALVTGSVSVGGRARVMDALHLHGKGRIGDDALLRGWGEINTVAEAPLLGGVVGGEDLECHLSAHTGPIKGGMLYGFLTSEIILKELEDNHYLYAHWDFNAANGEQLRDIHADCTGILRGAPKYIKEGDRRAMEFNGRDQYVVVERHLVDSAALTFDVMLRWTGGSANQAVFDFGGPDCSLKFTPANENGKAALSLRKGNVVQTVYAPSALQKDKWTRVTLSIGEGQGRIFLDGQPAAHGPVTLVPGDMGISAGYIGRSFANSGYFAGQLDDFCVYRCATSDVKSLAENWKSPADWVDRGGVWTLDAGVFRQSNAGAKEAVLYLPSSANWNDYSIKLQARRLAGPNAFRIHFRSSETFDKTWVADLGQDGKGCALKKNGVTLAGPNYFVKPEWDKWQDVEVRVRGNEVGVSIGGQKAIDTIQKVDTNRGGIGLGTRESAAEFCNIIVLGADGKTLYESSPSGH